MSGGCRRGADGRFGSGGAAWGCRGGWAGSLLCCAALVTLATAAPLSDAKEEIETPLVRSTLSHVSLITAGPW